MWKTAFKILLGPFLNTLPQMFLLSVKCIKFEIATFDLKIAFEFF